MNIEGMWALQSDQHDAPGQLAAGSVIILQTEKIFGGDSMMAYKGSFSVSADKFEGKVHAWRWNPAYAGQENVFGIDPGPDGVMVDFRGHRLSDNELFVEFGTIGFEIRIGRLTKLEELP